MPIRKPTRKALVKRLDKYFSVFIRDRDKRCVTCGDTQNLTNGHLFSRIAYSTRWDELNCHAQCYSCNLRHEFDFYPYQSWFVRTYGQDAYDALHFKYNATKKFYDSDLQDLIDHYRKLV